MAEERQQAEKNKQRFSRSVAVVLALVALWGAGVAYLQSDASNKATQATRDAVTLAIEIVVELGRANARTEYDLRGMTDWATLTGESQAYSVTAMVNQGIIDEALVRRYHLESQVRQAQADFLIGQSALLSDARYAAPVAGYGDSQAYMDDTLRYSQELLAEQNAAVDRANEWGTKADSYSSVMAVIAVALFFLGLSLVPEGSSRLVFLVVGLLISAASVAWTLSLMLG